MRSAVLAFTLATTACASGQDSSYIGPLTLVTNSSASETSTGGSTGDESEAAGAESDSSAAVDCDGECEPGMMDTRPCPGTCAVQERVCESTCEWGAWSVCGASDGVCEPDATQSCGMCMAQTCTDACEWGACEAVPCEFMCMNGARNGSEICDDEGFQMPDSGPLFLYCEDANGGVAYVSNNTGPVMDDGVARCQGWEVNMQNAWDFLDYVYMMTCDEAGKYLQIELPPGTVSHFGVHDQPTGGGHLTSVCVATLLN